MENRLYILGFGVAFIFDIVDMGFIDFFGTGFIVFELCIFGPDVGTGLVP